MFSGMIAIVIFFFDSIDKVKKNVLRRNWRSPYAGRRKKQKSYCKQKNCLSKL